MPEPKDGMRAASRRLEGGQREVGGGEREARVEWTEAAYVLGEARRRAAEPRT